MEHRVMLVSCGDNRTWHHVAKFWINCSFATTAL